MSREILALVLVAGPAIFVIAMYWWVYLASRLFSHPWVISSVEMAPAFVLLYVLVYFNL